MDNKFPKNHKLYRLPLIGCDIYFFTDKKSFVNAEKSLGIDAPVNLDNSSGYTARYTNDECVIFYMFGVFEHDYSYFVHELFHLVVYICDAAGVQIDPNNHEISAYIMGDLMKEFKEYYDIKIFP